MKRTTPLPVVALIALFVLGAVALVWQLVPNGDEAKQKDLVIFCAAGLVPMLEAAKPRLRDDLGLRLVLEASGSQVAARKVTELGKRCDLLLLADPNVVTDLMTGYADWRVDFAMDEMVLAVGSRAPHTDEAEKDWVSVLLRPEVKLARVDETQGPVGYRTLLVWHLAEAQGKAGLYDELMAKNASVVDHVTSLTGLLRNGEADYAFVYRSICISQDIRYIPLPTAINLGSPDTDYSSAKAVYTVPSAALDRQVTVVGEPVVWSLTIPRNPIDAEAAMQFTQWLMKQPDLVSSAGFRHMKPARYYGPKDALPSALEPLVALSGPLRGGGD